MTRPDWDADEHDPDAKHDERGHRSDDRTDRDVIEYRPNREQRGTWLSALLAVFGFATIGGVLVLEFAASHVWNGVLVGSVLLVVGAYNLYRRRSEEIGSVGAATLATIAGLWLATSPFLFGPESGEGVVAVGTTAGLWFLVIVGVATFAIGGVSAAVARKRRRDADARPTAVYDRRGQ
ncbi:hypothetical protein [Natronobacterium texcoconense]|uniref:SPW repeat-containing protein n=1 Tax=Natronobacterium texcoconense TaxID=1095778 RepID=A0A1H1J530_NATTX|nr:hypothetical protein [Natronobacterium texcoconense]SDR45039.1 hypothetical protein SAMN04489842_4145 [Natronobacterium texcoconense]